MQTSTQNYNKALIRKPTVKSLTTLRMWRTETGWTNGHLIDFVDSVFPIGITTETLPSGRLEKFLKLKPLEELFPIAFVDFIPDGKTKPDTRAVILEGETKTIMVNRHYFSHFVKAYSPQFFFTKKDHPIAVMKDDKLIGMIHLLVHKRPIKSFIENL